LHHNTCPTDQSVQPIEAMLAPELETAHLTVRPFDMELLTERYVSWLNDRETVRYSEQRHRRHTIESCRQYFDTVRKSPNWILAILLKSDGPAHIGNIGVTFDRANRTADIAILIGESAGRGQGYGKEAWSAVMAHLLGPAEIRKVTAGTMAANSAMIALATSSGMHEEARLKGHFLLDGRPVDCIRFARFAERQG